MVCGGQYSWQAQRDVQPHGRVRAAGNSAVSRGVALGAATVDRVRLSHIPPFVNIDAGVKRFQPPCETRAFRRVLRDYASSLLREMLAFALCVYNFHATHTHTRARAR